MHFQSVTKHIHSVHATTCFGSHQDTFTSLHASNTPHWQHAHTHTQLQFKLPTFCTRHASKQISVGNLWELLRLEMSVWHQSTTNNQHKMTNTINTRQKTLMFNSYLQTSVGAPSATTLLQHGLQFLLPLKIVPPYTVSSTTSSLTS